MMNGFVRGSTVTSIPPRVKFTPVEDAMLMNIVARSGTVNWKYVSEMLGHRTARQCRERYHNYLAPNVRDTEWTTQEDDLLRDQYGVMGPQWAHMRDYFPGKSCVNIKNRWARLSAGKPKTAEVENSSQVMLDIPPAIVTLESKIERGESDEMGGVLSETFCDIYDWRHPGVPDGFVDSDFFAECFGDQARDVTNCCDKQF